MKVGVFVFCSEKELRTMHVLYDNLEVEDIYGIDYHYETVDLSSFIFQYCNKGDILWLRDLKDLGRNINEVIMALQVVLQENIRLKFLYGVENQVIYHCNKRLVDEVTGLVNRLKSRSLLIV